MLVRGWCPRFLMSGLDGRKRETEILSCGHRTKIGSLRFEGDSRTAEPYTSYFIRRKELGIEIRRVLGE